MDLRDWLLLGIIVLIIIGITVGVVIGAVNWNKKIAIEVFEEKVQIIEQHNLKPELVKILINNGEKEV